MQKNETEKQGQLAATLTLTEVGLGSLLHSFHVPLSGHALSINQSVLLSRFSFKHQCARTPLVASIVAALLKSLSPAGKKLTPMLAISAQGFLTSIGFTIFGINLFGLFISSALAASWAFVQPALIMYVIFGNQGFEVLEYFSKQLGQVIPGFESKILFLILAFYILKVVIVYFLSWSALRLSDLQFEKIQSSFLTKKSLSAKSQVQQPAFLMAFKDLCTPLFVLSLALTLCFFIFVEASQTTILWALLRPLAIGYILFYFFRVYPFAKVIHFLKSKKLNALAQSLEYSIKRIQS